jgi:hypothetical protein
MILFLNYTIIRYYFLFFISYVSSFLKNRQIDIFSSIKRFILFKVPINSNNRRRG